MPPLVFGGGPPSPPTGAHPRPGGPVDARTGARTPATTDGLTDGAAVCPACPVPRRLSLPYLSWVRARHCVGWGTTIHLLLFLPPRAGRGPLLSPSLPPDQRAARAQRDGDFVCTVLLINPALRSRDKARELSAALHWTRDEVYETAEGVGISLRACSSHAEMAAPPRDLFRDVDVEYVKWRLLSGAIMEAVADEVGCCPRSLQRLMRRHGIEHRHDIKWSDLDIEEAILALRDSPGFEHTGVTFTHGTRVCGPRPSLSLPPPLVVTVWGPAPPPSPFAFSTPFAFSGRLCAEGYVVSREQVARVLRAVDPDGALQRWKRCLKRREYAVRTRLHN